MRNEYFHEWRVQLSQLYFHREWALTRKTTKSDLLDMFVMGTAYRTRSNSDVILMFRKAFAENPAYATIAQLVERRASTAKIARSCLVYRSGPRNDRCVRQSGKTLGSSDRRVN